MIVDGVRWWTTQQAVDQLGVTRKTINQWVRRSRLAGHTAPATSCPACAEDSPAEGRELRPSGRKSSGRRRFPHVDPPRASRRGRGGLAAYVADQLLAAEVHTAGCGLGVSCDRVIFDEIDAST